MRAGLLLRADLRERAAADLRRALAIAHEQDAPAMQLRAATDLARLLSEHGERQQAAGLITPIYDGFTEGFDTADLIEAKALLDQLH